MSDELKQQAMKAKAAEAEEYDEEEELEEEAGGHRFLFFTAMPAWLVSMVVHAVALLVMAMITVGGNVEQVKAIITAAPGEELQEIEEFEEQLTPPVDVDAVMTDAAIPVEMITEAIPEDVTDVVVSNDIDQAAIAVELVDFGQETAPRGDLMKDIGSYTGTGYDGRGSAEARARLARSEGGSDASEAAVAAALRWIADHQLQDGGWSFDHRIGPILNGRPRTSDHPGQSAQARRGATAMAILPFLGAGQTHNSKDSKYRATVQGGLKFLIDSMKPDGSLHEAQGNMYSHGLAAIALCEAYGMTHDKALMVPAQASLNFISYAQDPIGGGWRYSPRQPGDTSVVGWQLMALKSGHMSFLQVNPLTIRGAIKFLDTVQAGSGSFYGYADPGQGQATTAIGLLCRMYLGWKQENEALKRGVEWLSNQGPSLGNDANMYYNYYGTQVCRQYGDEVWEKWNGKMRDFLVNSQSKDMPAQGSWYFAGGHGAEAGGRLYNTSLATMVLEVYYRHMPIYQQQATKEDFPL
jgi:hypothetical protein